MNESILFITSVILFVFIVSTLIKFLTPKIKGYLGESAVTNILLKLPSDRYRVLNNIMLPTDNRTTQIDHVVVSLYGIFVIETKNYKGMISGGEYSETWTNHLNGKKYTFRNPIKQNYGHVKALEQLLGLTDKCFIPIVVFSLNANVKVKSSNLVIHTNKLKHCIESYNEEQFQLNEVY